MQEEPKFYVDETEHGCCFRKRVVKGVPEERLPEPIAEFVEEEDAEAYAKWRNEKKD